MPRSFSWALAALFVPMAASAENWPGWRGPHNLGISTEKDLPLQWSASKNVCWKAPIPGAGVSCPVVWNDFIFLTGSDGRLNDRLHIFCFHRRDGRQLWHTRLFGTAPTDLYPPGGMAVPTGCTDGQYFYALFGTGDLVCLDFQGQPVWMRSLAEEYGPFRNRWGMASSPILVGDRLIVQVDHWSQSYLLAVDKRSGDNIWKTDRSTSVNWSSPLAIQVKGRTEIIALGTTRVWSYDPKDGKEIWQASGPHFQCIPSPVVQGDLLFAASGENTLAIRLDGNAGDVTKTHVLWTNKKVSPYVPSPLVYDGFVYVPGDRSFVTCLDAGTGKQVWKERLGQQYHASPVASAGRIYFASMEGVVRIIKAGPRYELLAENDIGERIVASPALSKGQIFLRGDKHLYCISEK